MKCATEILLWLHPNLKDKVKVFVVDDQFTKVQIVVVLKSCHKGYRLTKDKMEGLIPFLEEMKGKAIIIANNHDADIMLTDEKDEALFLLKYS